MRWLVVAIAFLGLGCKGNPEKCDKACRHYAELVFWQEADAEIAAAPPEQRDELRKQKLAKFTSQLEKGINMCTSQCVSASGMSDTQVDCMIEAKTAEQAKDCSGH
jgi:hypothetical protein